MREDVKEDLAKMTEDTPLIDRCAAANVSFQGIMS